MARKPIIERLASGDLLLMDGGTGSELQRRGVDVLKGADPDNLGAWSATANLDAPEIVKQVHLDFLEVGAEIIISNSFWTSPSRLERAGLGDRWKDYAAAAARLAVEARDEANPEAYVSIGIAPPTMQGKTGRRDSDIEILGEQAVFDEFAQHARVAAAEGPDIMLPEYIGHIADCVAAVDGCATTGLPVMLGIRHLTIEGTMQYGELVEDLCKELRNHDVATVLLMCSTPEAISATLPALRRSFDGPIGAYPNIGYRPLTPLKGGPESDIYSTVHTPEILAGFAREWIDMGAQIIGGCCSTTLEHIAAMRPVVKE